MPTIELTDAELGQLYDAVDRGLCSLDDQLTDRGELRFYSDRDWSKIKKDRDHWALLLGRLATAIEETASANC